MISLFHGFATGRTVFQMLQRCSDLCYEMKKHLFDAVERQLNLFEEPAASLFVRFRIKERYSIPIRRKSVLERSYASVDGALALRQIVGWC